jgi:hypothetical protein
MALQLAVLLLSLALFTACGLPVAALLGRSMPAMAHSAPALGAAVLAVFATLLYTSGLSIQAIAAMTVVLALISVVCFRTMVLQQVKEAIRQPWATGLFLLFSAIIASPILTNRPAFTVFQGNQWDHFGYVTSAAVFSKMLFRDVVDAVPAEVLSNPLLPVASASCYARPAVHIVFALIGVLVPGGIAVGGYAFLCSFAIAGLLAFKGFLLQLFGPVGSRGILAALLVSGSYACGFWGQYSLDIDAWSQVAATPLLISAWTLIFAVLTEPAPIGRDRRPASIAALGLLIAGALYFYPEGSVYNALILLGVVVLAWRSFIHQFPTLLGAFALGLALSALFWRGTIGFAVVQSHFATTAHVNWWSYFDRYLFGLDPQVNQSLQDAWSNALNSSPPDLGRLNAPFTALLTGVSGVLGVYFLTPEHYGAFTLLDTAKGGLLLLVLIGIAASVPSGLRSGPNSYRLLSSAAALGLLGAALLLMRGEAWSSGKALSFAAPLLCLAIVAPALSGARHAWLSVAPWCAAQACFAVLMLLGLRDPSGVRLPAPYPAIQDPLLKADGRWDIARQLQRVEGCPAVRIIAAEPFFRHYVAVSLYEAGRPFFYTEPVNAYFGAGKDLGSMAAAPVTSRCEVVQLGMPRHPVPPGPPAGVPSFPDGLRAKDLLFAGVSQDGWLTGKALVRLWRPNGSDRLHLTGDVPDFSPQISAGVMKIKVDGTIILERPEASGSFDLVLPIPAATGTRSIELEMTGADHLPPPDGRLVSVQLRSIALEGPDEDGDQDDSPE